MLWLPRAASGLTMEEVRVCCWRRGRVVAVSEERRLPLSSRSQTYLCQSLGLQHNRSILSAHHRYVTINQVLFSSLHQGESDILKGMCLVMFYINVSLPKILCKVIIYFRLGNLVFYLEPKPGRKNVFYTIFNIILHTFNICFKLKRYTVRPRFSKKNTFRIPKINVYTEDLKNMKSRIMMFYYYLYKHSPSEHVNVIY